MAACLEFPQRCQPSFPPLPSLVPTDLLWGQWPEMDIASGDSLLLVGESLVSKQDACIDWLMWKPLSYSISRLVMLPACWQLGYLIQDGEPEFSARLLENTDATDNSFVTCCVEAFDHWTRMAYRTGGLHHPYWLSELFVSKVIETHLKAQLLCLSSHLLNHRSSAYTPESYLGVMPCCMEPYWSGASRVTLLHASSLGSGMAAWLANAACNFYSRQIASISGQSQGVGTLTSPAAGQLIMTVEIEASVPPADGFIDCVVCFWPLFWFPPAIWGC